ncbi:MAG: HPP family protein [Halothiobacillaceae bacterium]|nr:HPP family protein [Halothiobacillaceae bacterium]
MSFDPNFKAVFSLANKRIGVAELLVSIVGGFVGIFLVYHASHILLGQTGAAWMLASMGASAVLLFGAPHAAFAQPWPLFAGHALSALIGVTCAQWIGDPALAGACAVGLALGAMRLFHCIHPPGGGTALVAVIGGSSISALGYQYVLTPVLLNAVILFIAAVLINAPFKWRRYPMGVFTALSPPTASTSISSQALTRAVEETHLVVDVTAEELLEIALRAVELTCKDAGDTSCFHGRVLRISMPNAQKSPNNARPPI